MAYLKNEDADIKIAKFYLLESGYDIAKAKKNYDEDLKIDFSKNARLSQFEVMNADDIKHNIQNQSKNSKVQDSFGYKNNRGFADEIEEEELLIKKNK